jgi:gluconolactonase
MNSRSLQLPALFIFLLAVPLARLDAQAVAPPAGIVTPAVAPMILGVVSAGTPVELLADGFEAVEGPLPQLDDGLLFTNSRMNRVLRLAPDGKLTVWFEGAGGGNGLTRTPAGDIVATMTEARTIAVQPGQPARPWWVISKARNSPAQRWSPTARQHLFHRYSQRHAGRHSLPAAVYRSRASALVRIVQGVERPNGVALSPDERTLYVANTAESGRSPWARPGR